MSAPHKKASSRTPEAFDTNTTQQSKYITSSRGRRAIASLWNASRVISGAALTADDLALIREAVNEIVGVIE
ncbi:hypothetical protein HFV02_02045 [Acidithiobacillus caldus]|nr:hypothetical protein [Acidithiobacillus caldus]